MFNLLTKIKRVKCSNVFASITLSECLLYCSLSKVVGRFDAFNSSIISIRDLNGVRPESAVEIYALVLGERSVNKGWNRLGEQTAKGWYRTCDTPRVVEDLLMGSKASVFDLNELLEVL